MRRTKHSKDNGTRNAGSEHKTNGQNAKNNDDDYDDDDYDDDDYDNDDYDDDYYDDDDYDDDILRVHFISSSPLETTVRQWVVSALVTVQYNYKKFHSLIIKENVIVCLNTQLHKYAKTIRLPYTDTDISRLSCRYVSP